MASKDEPQATEYVCPFCGERFVARLIAGPPGNPPCIRCASEGKEPVEEPS